MSEPQALLTYLGLSRCGRRRRLVVQVFTWTSVVSASSAVRIISVAAPAMRERYLGKKEDAEAFGEVEVEDEAEAAPPMTP